MTKVELTRNDKNTINLYSEHYNVEIKFENMKFASIISQHMSRYAEEAKALILATADIINEIDR